MNIMICIDDTDNFESIGTGQLLQNFINENSDFADFSFISRHQLFIHDDIPYTSHNSSMCTRVKISNDDFDLFISKAKSCLLNYSADGSDPGLCIIKTDELNNMDKKRLIDFGLRAKKEVLTKQDAYNLASQIECVNLSEHGGTGQGIIGALAGCGLRMYGNDGRVKGKLKPETPNEILKGSQIINKYTKFKIDGIISLDRKYVDLDKTIIIRDDIKLVLKDEKPVLVVQKDKENQADFTLIQRKQYKEF